MTATTNCAAGCGAELPADDAAKQWEALPLTNRLRCWECGRALRAASRLDHPCSCAVGPGVFCYRHPDATPLERLARTSNAMGEEL